MLLWGMVLKTFPWGVQKVQKFLVFQAFPLKPKKLDHLLKYHVGVASTASFYLKAEFLCKVRLEKGVAKPG